MKGYKDGSGKFRPTENKNGVSKSRDQNAKTKGIRLKRITKKPKMIMAENISLSELRNHPLYEESTNWLDVFESTPEVIVANENEGFFYVWYGGESHYVHYVSPDGKEFNVFSFGFEKNRLDKDEVLEKISERLSDPEEGEE